MSNGYGKLNDIGYLMSSQVQKDSSWLPLSNFDTDTQGNYYSWYNPDGTPNVQKMASEATKALQEEAKQNITKTDTAMTKDMYRKMNKQEREAMEAYRDKNLSILTNTAVSPDEIDPIVLQSAFDKFKLGAI